MCKKDYIFSGNTLLSEMDYRDVDNYLIYNETCIGWLDHDCCLNIHYSTSEELCGKVAELFTKMPHWNGFVDGLPQWYGKDGELLEASVEAGRLHFSGTLPQEEWDQWFELFKSKASKTMLEPTEN